ncbi:MAG TPA: ABC transporter permease, partial [bacterium]
MKNRRTSILLWQLLILVAVLVTWEWGTQVAWLAKHVKILDPFFISTPSRIVQRFFELTSPQLEVTLWNRMLTTVLHTLGGFAVGVSTGFLAGLYLGRNPYAATVFEPYIIGINTLPRIALVPLVTLMFGFGSIS